MAINYRPGPANPSDLMTRLEKLFPKATDALNTNTDGIIGEYSLFTPSKLGVCTTRVIVIAVDALIQQWDEDGELLLPIPRGLEDKNVDFIIWYMPGQDLIHLHGTGFHDGWKRYYWKDAGGEGHALETIGLRYKNRASKQFREEFEAVKEDFTSVVEQLEKDALRRHVKLYLPLALLEKVTSVEMELKSY